MSGPVGFVGRHRELRVLEETLAAARAGRPQVVYIEADAGAGKSTLLSRFIVSVTAGAILEVCADEAETLLSYGIIDQLQPDALTEPGADPMIVGQRLVDLLDGLQADGQVVVLVIDDLQWIDRPSSRALLFALRRLRADTVLTVVATRAEGLIDPGWARFVAGDSRVTQIRLEGLTAEDLVEMASALELGVLSSRGAARLLAHTGGNPLYSRALLQEIGVAALNATDGGGLPAPRDLSAVILTRVAALSSDAQAFLAAASVLGQHAPIATTVAVAGLSDSMRGSDEAVAAGLLVEAPSPSELTFAHPLYRAAIYADLSPTNRRHLHALAADVVQGHAGLAHRVAATLGVAIADLGAAAARLRSGVPATYPVPCLSHLSEAHFRRGDWDTALTYARLATSLAQDADRPLDLARSHARSAQVLAGRGQWIAAAERVAAVREATARFPVVLAVATCAVAGVALASARGDLVGILAATEPVRATSRLGVGGLPGVFNWRSTEVDALIGLGRLSEAEVALRQFEQAMPEPNPKSAALALARCQGNLAAATGDPTGADAAFARGHAIAEATLIPLEQALLYLDDGRRLRSVGKHAEAVIQLESAHRLFSDLGADPFVRRSAEELELLQVSAAAQSPAAALGLSRAEMSVARLVATGLTNREVAGELYVSVKTVEYHLRNCFIKLDIASRRELADLLR